MCIITVILQNHFAKQLYILTICHNMKTKDHIVCSGITFRKEYSKQFIMLYELYIRQNLLCLTMFTLTQTGLVFTKHTFADWFSDS